MRNLSPMFTSNQNQLIRLRIVDRQWHGKPLVRRPFVCVNGGGIFTRFFICLFILFWQRKLTIYAVSLHNKIVRRYEYLLTKSCRRGRPSSDRTVFNRGLYVRNMCTLNVVFFFIFFFFVEKISTRFGVQSTGRTVRKIDVDAERRELNGPERERSELW